jgi:4-hydroxy-tetrahydrodipicolinate reductase
MNYGIVGYSGRMGMEIESLFSKNGHSLLYKKDNESEEIQGIPELLIDFSTPSAAKESLQTARGFACPIIIGTTGLVETDFEMMKTVSKIVPVVYSRNFSAGIMIMNSVVKMINGIGLGWDSEILEKHHRYKKDKPSGTALMLAENFENSPEISSMRLGNITGEHTVIYAGDEEVLEIKHSALSRSVFARGVLMTAEKIMEAKPGFYTFSGILGLEREEKQWIATK